MDGGASIIAYVALVFFVLGSGFWAGSEISYASMNKIRMKTLAEDGNTKAKKAMWISDHFDRTLTTLLIGNNVFHVAASSLATVIFVGFFGETSGPAIATASMTIIVFFVGELLPKCIAKANSERFALMVATPLRLIIWILTPFAVFFEGISFLAKKLFRINNTQPSVTEEELKDIVVSAEEEGGIQAEKGELVRSALEFSDTIVKQILTPRIDVLAVDINDPIDTIISKVLKVKYSRIPVYDGDLDNVIGTLRVSDFLKCILRGKPLDIREMISEPFFVHKSMKISALLDTFNTKKIHIAIVTDEYGGTLGIVTMEDILEELVGDIWDEDDVVKEEIVSLGDGDYQVAGDCNLTDLFEKLKINLENFDCEYDTVSGWAIDQFGGLPKPGDSFAFENLTVTAKEVDDAKILSLLVHCAQPEENTAGDVKKASEEHGA